MALRQNALDHQEEHAEAATAPLQALYVDDGVEGADSLNGAIKFREELQCLSLLGGFELRKWKASKG